MAECIERRAIFHELLVYDGKVCPDKDIDGNFFTIKVRDIKDAIRKIPAADVRPVVHGHWTPFFESAADERRGVAIYYHCSKCDRRVKDESYSHGLNYEFCPYCGAKMDGKDDKNV